MNASHPPPSLLPPLRAALALSAAFLHSCSSDFQFSQLEEFEAIRSSLGSQPPTPEQRALLEEHRPLFHLPDGHTGPIDFYRDYIAHGELRNREGSLVSRNVTRELLNQYKNDSEAAFAHIKPDAPAAVPPPPAVYAGIGSADIPALGGRFTFLSYYLVFRTSGLPAELGTMRGLLVRAVGDRRDWHQLDHYTSVFVVLGPSAEPCAVVLQQHNYMRTYVIRKGGEFAPGERVKVDVAIDSNELYPHSPERRRHRAAGFMDSASIDFLLALTDDVPLQGSYDVTEGARQVEYRLEYLPPDDAFYVFEGHLGERRRLPGRDGPPGAMYNTLPAFKPYETMLPSFYWHEGDAEYAELVRGLRDWKGTGLEDILPRLQERLAEKLSESKGDSK